MSLKAILRGTLAGAVAGVILAMALALVVFNTSMPDRVLAAGVWVADATVSLVAGWAAARRAESGAALQGLLAAVTLATVGNLLAELSSLPTGPLWGQLALAAVMGLAGGLMAILF
jgi:putative membrane protein (TIGR04086 family)